MRLGRYGAHKTVGVASLVLASLVVVSGVFVSIELFWRTHEGFAPANPILLVNVSDMLLFALAYLTAIASVKNPSAHPPLMFIAAFTLMNAVVFRLIGYTIGPGAAPVFLSHIAMALLMIAIFLWARQRYAPLPRRVLLITATIVFVTLVRIPDRVSNHRYWNDVAPAVPPRRAALILRN